jgi:hypothetical protein
LLFVLGKIKENKYTVEAKCKVSNGTTGAIWSYHYALSGYEPNTYK